MTRFVVAIALVGLAGCHRSPSESEPAKPPPPVAFDAAQPEEKPTMTTESLPAEVFLQIRSPSGRVERIQNDGKFLRADDGKSFVPAEALSTEGTPTPDTFSPGALARIREGLVASGFAKLPAKLPSTVPAGVMLPPRNDPPRLERWVFTARLEDGTVHTVEVQADTKLPSSFEALQPLYQVLDTEVWGFYRYE